MKMRVCVPTEILIDQPVRRIVAEAAIGSFCVLPRHTDFATSLVPGLFIYEDAAGQELFFATDTGLLVKRGPEVTVTVRQAIQGDDLESLRDAVSREFRAMDERTRKCQSAIASLEAHFLRRFLELEQSYRNA